MKMHVSLLCITLVSSLPVYLLGFLPNLLEVLFSNDQDSSAYDDLLGRELNHNISASAKKFREEKFVLLLVDALWSQFIFEAVVQNDGQNNWKMPYLKSLIQEQKACLYEAVADSPTVTLPRIKAILGGTVPSFIDILKNLKSERFGDDNLVTISRDYGKNIVFYGDDTWIRMFPDHFLRKEGTTSFFASDYTEVDFNVTRHLEKELAMDDWGIMILHYLGLDHIGHVHGPKSPLVGDKLKEMDDVVRKIDVSLKELGSKYTILLMGDHGMGVTGSHGGGSSEETSVPLVFIKDGCISRRFEAKRYRQIDVTPTIAALLGVRIPKQNLGIMIEDILLSDVIFSSEERLRAALANLKQLETLYLSYSFGNSARSLSLLSDTSSLELRMKTLNSTTNPESETNQLVMKASALCERFRAELQNNSANYDVYSMLLGSFMVFLVLMGSFALVFASPKQHYKTPSLVALFFTTVFAPLSHLTLCATACSTSAVCFNNMWLSLLALTTLILLSISVSRIMLTFQLSSLSFNLPQSFVLIGTFYHGLSLLSSSFIEEEHQTWYYLVPSLLVLISLQNLEAGWSKTDLGLKHGGLMKVIRNSAFISGILCVVVHRVAKFWNQTGDKWAKEPDIEDWLMRAENSIYLQCMLVLSLVGLAVVVGLQSKSLFQKVLFYLGLGAVGVFRLWDETSDHNSWSLVLPRLTYLAVAILLLSSFIIRNSSVVPALVLLFALLRRTHNIPLLLLMVVQARLVKQPLQVLLRYRNGKFFLFVAYYWIGMAWFFYQGNSNSLSRIDVAAGYIGLRSHQPLIVGVLLTLSTFQGPLLALCFYLQNSLTSGGKEESRFGGASLLLHLCLVRSFPLVLYLLTVVLLRHHLFIWTVFAPKLLYELALTLFLMFFCFIQILTTGFKSC